MKKLISVIVPVYNSENYIRKCIESILNQTYSNIELILVDDGSNDSSGKICDYYGEIDERIVVIHKKNEGVSKARNSGLEISRGDFIGFVDSDDWIEKEMFEQLYELIEKYKSDMSMCLYHDSGSSFKYIQKSIIENGVMEKSAALENVVSTTGFQGFVWNKLFSKELFYRNGVNLKFDENIYVCEDLLLVCHLINNTNSVAYTKNQLYAYSQRESSASNELSEKSLTGIQAKKQIIPIFDQYGIVHARAAYAYELAYLLSYGNEVVIKKRFSELKYELKKHYQYFWKVEYTIKERIIMIGALVSPKLFGILFNILRKIYRKKQYNTYNMYPFI